MNKSVLFQPLFPFQVEQNGTNIVYPGVSLFDFYASQAPRVPSDFNYVKPGNFPPHPGYFKYHFGKESDYKYKNYVLRYHADDEWVGEYEKEVPEDIRKEMEADIAAYNDKMSKYLINISAWQLTDKLEKQSQWAKAYATHMIAMREGVSKNRLLDMKEEDIERLMKLLDSSANEIHSAPNKDIYLIEELHTDSSENEASAAVWYTPFAYTDSLVDANSVCTNGGLVPKSTCWALQEDTPKYRHKLVKHLANIEPIHTIPAPAPSNIIPEKSKWEQRKEDMKAAAEKKTQKPTLKDEPKG